MEKKLCRELNKIDYCASVCELSLLTQSIVRMVSMLYSLHLILFLCFFYCSILINYLFGFVSLCECV